MILAGAWLAMLGYGILYAGVFKLANPRGTCGLKDAFMGTCDQGAAASTGTGGANPRRYLPTQVIG